MRQSEHEHSLLLLTDALIFNGGLEHIGIIETILYMHKHMYMCVKPTSASYEKGQTSETTDKKQPHTHRRLINTAKKKKQLYRNIFASNSKVWSLYI
ncbi:hypothetical protein NQ318_008699 [Aromia moschata]|uniref:Maturase K n=1 Tax=Aromia moschata TaxID=1265417 RepID=A0AAV8X5E4_9CUCU|nr:hypothetical protein NQ318_008699 [Aromia moschata]